MQCLWLSKKGTIIRIQEGIINFYIIVVFSNVKHYDMNKFGTEKIRRLENFLEADSFRQLEWVGDEDLDFEKAIGEFFYWKYILAS